MKATFSLLLLLICCGCTAPIVKTLPSIKITPLTIELPENSSFRGLSKLNNIIAIGGSPNLIGIYENGQIKLQSISDTLESDFRAIGQTNENLFSLRAGSPAKLYQINKQTLKHQLVYVETDKNVFYDALHFFNNKDGIAFGDELNGCMSVITTNNGGGSWQKLDCEKFLPAPKGAVEESIEGGSSAAVDSETPPAALVDEANSGDTATSKDEAAFVEAASPPETELQLANPTEVDGTSFNSGDNANAQDTPVTPDRRDELPTAPDTVNEIESIQAASSTKTSIEEPVLTIESPIRPEPTLQPPQ